MDDISRFPNFLTKDITSSVFEKLKTSMNWQDELRVTGSSELRKISRKMSYVADKPVIYRYAGLELDGELWIPELAMIRDKLISIFSVPFNSVLLNLYEDGKDEIRWHSDKEEQLGLLPVIACINLGATRKFWFMNKSTGIKVPWDVSDGDLLMMGETCQQNYLHAILKEKEVTEARISLTYRRVYE